MKHVSSLKGAAAKGLKLFLAGLAFAGLSLSPVAQEQTAPQNITGVFTDGGAVGTLLAKPVLFDPGDMAYCARKGAYLGVAIDDFGYFADTSCGYVHPHLPLSGLPGSALPGGLYRDVGIRILSTNRRDWRDERLSSRMPCVWQPPSPIMLEVHMIYFTRSGTF